ncbi:hypothetical protein, partial [Burkholderia cepacia]|uniref:hypothetical protein n=1 Tax=Burkholderia cepacia TaxID=292 RepID=UPI001E536735
LEFDSSMPPFLDFTKRWLPFFPTGLTPSGLGSVNERTNVAPIGTNVIVPSCGDALLVLTA